jgi:hypothetical protein
VSKHLWKRDTHYHVVEIKVGPTWVEKHRTQFGQEEAERLSRIELVDRSVSAVRIHEHRLSHICTETFEEQANPTLKRPRGMRLTNHRAACPACGFDVEVLSETGGTLWAFCGVCKKALPVSKVR